MPWRLPAHWLRRILPWLALAVLAFTLTSLAAATRGASTHRQADSRWQAMD